MSKTINVKLSTSGINNAIKEIEKFKKDLNAKLERFVSLLADVGIEIAKHNILVEENGSIIDRSDHVEFTKDVNIAADGVKCIIVATASPYVTQWKKSKNGKNVLSAQVNPLLMAEFGSGANAIDGHAGTFPSATAKKNVSHGSWAWYDLDGNKHVTTGNVPSRPLFKAKEEMVNQILTIAKSVFGTGV